MTKIDWIPIFSKLSEIKPGETVMAHLDRKNFSAQKRVEGSGSLFVYLHGQNLFVATVDVPQVKDERLLGNIDIIKLMKTKQPFLLKKRQQCRKVKKSQQDSKEKLPSIQFFKKGNWFYIFKEIIKKDLTPFLAKAIKGESDVDLSVVLSSKSYSGIEIHLDRSLYSFVAEKSTKIMFKDYIVCEVKIVGGVKAVYLGDEPKNNLTYTIGSFFTPSKKYSLITQQNPMIAKATVKLIQECHTALPRLD